MEITVCIWIITFVANIWSVDASANKRLLIVHRNRRRTKQTLSKCTAQDYRAFPLLLNPFYKYFSHTKFLFPSYSVKMDFGEQTEMSARKKRHYSVFKRNSKPCDSEVQITTPTVSFPLLIPLFVKNMFLQ